MSLNRHVMHKLKIIESKAFKDQIILPSDSGLRLVQIAGGSFRIAEKSI
jgi:hypothetical protein